MSIDTSVAKRVGFQCLYLAGPGVLICGFGTASFLSVFLGWDFKLSLCAGAILCATDPVAVVALLKELGASPMLTVQIQGESLLNDGTAIVLYLISYNMISGENYDAADISEFLVKKAMMAWALGLFIGYFFFAWIHMAADKLDHSSSMIQITLTLCCAYWSFIFVEGVLMLSGVLATVASSLVLAHHMWPYVVSEESMHHVWHTFESLGNIIIFFLAGSITGSIVVDIDPIDIINLLVIYVFLLFMRGGLLFASKPILKLLSSDNTDVSWQELTLMTWGGLRGAVGLALAIVVNNDLAPHIDTQIPQIAKKGW
jgi:NhaP-type Na+/H+ or K+/H+ antiporter